MRRTLLYLSMLAIASFPIAQRAAAQQDLLTINVPGGTYTLLLPNQPSVTDFANFTAETGQFALIGLTATGPGGINSINENVVFYDAADGGGLEDFNNPTFAGLNFAMDQSGDSPTSLFNNNDSDPTFTIGTGTVSFSNSDTTTYYSYSLEPVGTTVTPEPSSLLLLGTGMGMIAAFRRRLFA